VTAPNHALTGAVIGLTIQDPLLAMPLAFLSHFACDAIPHYDPAFPDGPKRLESKEFIGVQLVAGPILCFALVLCLAIARPHHWITAAICAFLAASPDLFWAPRFFRTLKTHTDNREYYMRNPFLRIHSLLQWKTGPKLWVVEAAWFVIFSSIVASRL
jgi:hypothetical protein